MYDTHVCMYTFRLDDNAWLYDVILNPSWRKNQDGGVAIFNVQYGYQMKVFTGSNSKNKVRFL